MFVRKKRNQSGSTSVQIIDKSGNKYRVVNTVGSSNNPVEIGRLLKRAYAKLDSIEHEKQLRLFPSTSLCEDIVNDFLDIIGNENIRTIGPELIFGTVFDRIGFNAIPEDMFRYLVITRLVYPASKLKTVDYIYRHQGQIISEDAVYKFLDRFKAKHKDEAERIAFAYTQKTIKNISVVFYDMTTLYFEAEKEDELRKIGFSKDGKFQKPQIMLGLLVAEHGYPIGYDIFEGNTFEGHTLLPVLEGMQKRFNLARPVVVADAALLSDKNIRTLSEKQYQFIIGARIKNESKEVKKVILKKSLCMKNGDSFSIEKNDGQRLIVTYSDNRAKKDAYNRERGVKRLQQRIKAGRLTKESINNRGYNKFLILHGQVQVAIDKQKVQNDQQWDGLKGYITNTRLRNKTVVENYRHLWKIEKAFRISKHDLKIRPVYHYKRNRIEAHICIAFVAYTVWKELERLLSANKTQMTPARAADLACNMYAIEYQLAESGEIKQKILNMTPEQQSLWQAVRK